MVSSGIYLEVRLLCLTLFDVTDMEIAEMGLFSHFLGYFSHISALRAAIDTKQNALETVKEYLPDGIPRIAIHADLLVQEDFEFLVKFVYFISLERKKLLISCKLELVAINNGFKMRSQTCF